MTPPEPYELVDVSMYLDDFTFPGDQPLQVTGPLNVLAGSNPEYVYELVTATQAGTHVQAPHYFLEAGARIDQIPLTRFEGRAHLVEVTRRGADTTAADLRPLLDHRRLDGEILILRTGHMDEVIASGSLDPATRPGLALDAAAYLAEEKKIGMIAVDSVGVESRATSNYDVNVYLCRQGVLILEGLVNLHRLHSDDLWLEAFPLKIRGVEGTPCRAVVKQGRPAR